MVHLAPQYTQCTASECTNTHTHIDTITRRGVIWNILVKKAKHLIHVFNGGLPPSKLWAKSHRPDDLIAVDTSMSTRNRALYCLYNAIGRGESAVIPLSKG